MQDRAVAALGDHIRQIEQAAIVVRWPGEFKPIALQTDQLVGRIESPATGVEFQIEPQVGSKVKRIGSHKIPEQTVAGIALAHNPEFGVSVEIGRNITKNQRWQQECE